jgi:hypothetical protein
MTQQHTHRAVRTEERSYRGPVGRTEVPQAHGGVCRVAHCRCGAVRESNHNQGHSEYGPWEVQP